MKKLFIAFAVASLIFTGVAFADVQGQAQGQVANQRANNSADNNNSQQQGMNSNIDLSGQGRISDSFNSTGMRGFAIPGDVQYGPVINYFGKPLPSEGFQPVEQIIMYSCWFTEGALEEMASAGMFGKTEADVRIVNPTAMAKPAAEDGKTRWIKVVVQTSPVKDVTFKGFVTARATAMDATMVNVMANAALDAMNKGANVIHFSAQGAVRDVFSKGWGIGIGATFASIMDSKGDQDRSGVAYGGTGFSSAKAGTRDLPWLQGFALVDEAAVYPKLPVPAKDVKKAEAPADTQTGNHIPKKS